MEIARELLDHYLTVTGWTLDDGWWVRGTDVVPNDDELDYRILVLARRENTTSQAIAFRLGLCAAAEEAYETHHPWLSARLLRAADIDPEAWERARRR